MKLKKINFKNKEDYNLWEKYIISRKDTTCVDSAAWRLFFKELYNFQNYSYLCIENSRVLGAISLYHIESFFSGNILVSSPFFCYGGIYWDSETVKKKMLKRIEKIARILNVDYIEIRSDKKIGLPYQINEDFYEFNLYLPHNYTRFWSETINSNVRQNIRKAKKYNFYFNINSDYNSCYGLLCKTMRYHGTPFHGKKFFILLKKYFKNNVFFSEVIYKNKLVAGGIIVKFKNSIITPYIGSLKKFRNLGTNYYQYWNIIKKFCYKNRIKIFEFGRSRSKSINHINFKKKWGTKKIKIYYNYLILKQNKEYFTVSEPSKWMLFAIKIWKKLPLLITKNIGPSIFKNVP